MVGENVGFYFSLDVDDFGNLKSAFWADGISIEAYKEFGEVVSFHTSYLVKEYEIPFASFVGVNHHGKTILLGCRLLWIESSEIFVWLFGEWLKCMFGKAPIAIITDHAREIDTSIGTMFPCAKHRWCLWHLMMGNLSEKFGAYKKFSEITSAIKIVVYVSPTSKDFEESWVWMVNKYDLGYNRWLKDIYEERRLWVPCYLTDTFWAGMSSTRINEAVKAFFDGYITARTTPHLVLEQYECIRRDKMEEEKEADAISSFIIVLA